MDLTEDRHLITNRREYIDDDDDDDDDNNNNNSNNNFSAIIEEAEKAPGWLTTGVTYLIPKAKS
jgi:hypothetical protein